MSTDKHIIVWVQRFKGRTNLVLQWHDPFTNQRKSKSAETTIPAVAEMKRTELEYELNHGLHKEASRMSWEKFRELFEAEHVSALRLNTRLCYGDTLNQFEKVMNPGRLSAINERTISAFAAALRKLPVRGRVDRKAGTIKTRLRFLRTALRWAAEQKLIPACPCIPRIDSEDRLPRPVPVESFERIHAKAEGDAPLQAYLLCGWLAGLRLSEANALSWEETEESPYVDLPHDRIVLPAKVVKGKSDQWVPLDPALREALEALPRHGKKVFRFQDERTGEPIKRNAISKRIISLAKKAGVRLSMHTLRKGFGCRYAGKVPAQVLQKLMRHASIKTTMDFYANVDDAVMEAVLGAKRNGPRNSGTSRPAGVEQEDATSDNQDSTSGLS